MEAQYVDTTRMGLGILVCRVWYAASYLGATSAKVLWRNLILRACLSQLPLAARLSSAAIVHARCRCR